MDDIYIFVLWTVKPHLAKLHTDSVFSVKNMMLALGNIKRLL